jgi:hypothetical protein
MTYSFNAVNRKCGTLMTDVTREYFVGYMAENKLQKVIHSSFSSQKNSDINKIEQINFLQFCIYQKMGQCLYYCLCWCLASVWNDGA